MAAVRIPGQKGRNGQLAFRLAASTVSVFMAIVALDNPVVRALVIAAAVGGVVSIAYSERRVVFVKHDSLRLRTLRGSSTIDWSRVAQVVIRPTTDGAHATVRWRGSLGALSEQRGVITTPSAADFVRKAERHAVPVDIANVDHGSYEARVQAHELAFAVGRTEPGTTRPKRRRRDWIVPFAVVGAMALSIFVTPWITRRGASPDSAQTTTTSGAGVELFAPSTGNLLRDERSAAEAEWRSISAPAATIDCAGLIPLDPALGAPRFVRVIGPFGTLTSNVRYEVASPTGVGGPSLIGGFRLDELIGIADAETDGEPIDADEAKQVWLRFDSAGIWFRCD